jgi:hypothetical protein
LQVGGLGLAAQAVPVGQCAGRGIGVDRDQLERLALLDRQSPRRRRP